MFDSIKDLIDKMRLGEDTYLEMKEIRFAGHRISGPSREDLADELAAFANARGGVCVLGVEDKTREVIGIPLALLDRAETFVREICNDSIEPPLFAENGGKSWPTGTIATAFAIRCTGTTSVSLAQCAYSCT